MTKHQTVMWDKVDQTLKGLETDFTHSIMVQREAIPLVFVPGIMGTRLRRAGTTGDPGDPSWFPPYPDGMPDLRWDPSEKSLKWMVTHYIGRSAKWRKDMLVGERFSSKYLEVDDNGTFGEGYDGFYGIMDKYCIFLNILRAHDWGELGKIFEFPVYAVGYNWTDDSANSGKMLKERIETIIGEAKKITGLCRKVIVITHSMGGLVSRWASEMAGAKGSILGIIHGVQPVTGAPAAYWRIKAGFESPSFSKDDRGGFIHRIQTGLEDLGASHTLGPDGPTVTAVLGNIPGGLQLLPNKNHRAHWLTITRADEIILKLPTLGLHGRTDPYKEIYEIPAVVRRQTQGGNKYWGLVDPHLLNPGAIVDPPGNLHDAVANAMIMLDAWSEYRKQLSKAEIFHDNLGLQSHLRTFCSWGTGFPTANVVQLKVESDPVIMESDEVIETDPYPTRGFRGMFTDDGGDRMRAVLQQPSGEGDGTVPTISATALKDPGTPFPGDRPFHVKHQPEYEDAGVQQFTLKAILALCKMHYKDCRPS